MFGGGFDPGKLEQMMQQMGIDMDEIDAETVTITTQDGDELVFDEPEVTAMEAQGQTLYQVLGEPEQEVEESTESDTADEEDDGIPQEDIDIVAQRAGVTDDRARDALEESDGDLATAIESLS